MSSAETQFDAWLNAELRDVPPPEGLVERLQQIATISDEELDAALRNVPIPLGLTARLQRSRPSRFPLEKMGRLALAVSLLIAVGLAYLGLVLSFLVNSYVQPKSIARHGTGLDPDAISLELWDEREPAVEWEGVEMPLPADSPWAALDRPGGKVPQFALPESDELSPSGRSRQFGFAIPKDLDLLDSVNRWPEVRVGPNPFDEIEDLDKVPGLKPRGMDIPRGFGYDVAFLSKTGFHPFVSPATGPQLRTVLTPLGSDTASFELAQRYLRDGELPPRSELRTEEFLAAIDYQFPRPRDRALGLILSGGQSPFRGPNVQLLQLGVQARDLPAARRAATRLTLAVDVSGSMRWGDRLGTIRRAVEQLLDRALAEDRISLVAFQNESYTLVEGASPEQRDDLLAALDSLQPEGPTNVAAGLRSAFSVAQRETPSEGTANRVVLLTDGLTEMDQATAAQIDLRLADAAARGVQLHVVDLSQRDAEEEEPDPLLKRLAQKGNGRVFRAAGVDQVRWALEEILTGQSQRVAADAQLKVTFNPKAVAFYRLLGHEPRTVIALKAAQPQADFCAGQSSTVLYEVVLLPKGSDEVALAELTWRDPRDGQVHRASQTFRRGQFAALLYQAPLSLQAAAMVAEAAEVLRLSPFHPAWPNAGSLQPVLQLSRQVDSRIVAEPSYAAFLELLEKAVAARPSRSGGEPKLRPMRDANK